MQNRLFSLVVGPREVAVAYRDGTLLTTLGSGRHPRRFRTRYLPVRMNERLLQLAPQDVPCSDGVQVRVSAVVRWEVADAVRFLEQSEDASAVVYLATQIALRDALSASESTDVARVARQEPQLGSGVISAVQPVAEQVGIRVLGVIVKDVILPIELRQAIAETVVARHRGAAALEAARAQTAALRSLANGAKLLEDNPALARLKLVEAAGNSKVVVRID